ncbi:MAG: dipeptidase [Methylocystis sp.]|nr:dipeptidase [Methylocystis sp.]MCA3586218.1 dipeptidase [Methylocystis sp.]MCA3587437.1 dipeptidase [Methylocystis sp.]MCA3592694.1 dipeptidase [Methylocystis sp.]
MSTIKPATLARARAFLERAPLVDGHNDLPYVVRKHESAKGDVAAYALERAHQETDTDIPRLKAGKAAAQFWAAFCPTQAKDPSRFTLEQIQLIRSVNALHPDVFLPALKASDIRRAKRQGKIASFIAVESGIGIGDRLEMLDIFYALGARYMTLCHNETLDWVDSATDAPRHNGLTDFGRNVIRRMNEIGLLVDLSHTTPKVMHDVLDIASAPAAITHANARTLCDHPRNVDDSVLERLKANGGIVMATFVPAFINQALRDWLKPLQTHGKTPLDADIGALIAERARRTGPAPKATLAQFCDHVDYLANKAGIDHVGIGSDFFGGATPEGLEDVSKFPDLIAALMERGWSDTALAKLAGRNVIRVLRGVEKAAKPAA